MHIELTEANKNKFLPKATELGMSVGEICNRILAAVDSLEISDIVKFSPKQNSEAQNDAIHQSVRKRRILRTRF